MSIRISDCAEAMNMEPCESASQKRDSMMLPLRWCAPEILQDKCHTFASDGIILVLMYCEREYRACCVSVGVWDCDVRMLYCGVHAVRILFIVSRLYY